MAVYFELKRDGNAVPFTKIDDEMCEALGVPCDPINYYKNWYDTIGFSIACGKSWDELREFWPEKVEIVNFLEANFEKICYGGR